MRQEYTNKVERQRLQDAFKTGHGVYGAERWAVRKKGRIFHTTEMRIFLENVRNVDIWKEAHMYPMAEFLREKRLRWFGHVVKDGNVINVHIRIKNVTLLFDQINGSTVGNKCFR